MHETNPLIQIPVFTYYTKHFLVPEDYSYGIHVLSACDWYDSQLLSGTVVSLQNYETGT
jgi:hypothetical protein